MSQEIQEYILNHYSEFTTSNIERDTDFSYLNINTTIYEMEKKGLVKWQDNIKRYIVTKPSVNAVSNTTNTGNVARDFNSQKERLKKFSESVPSEIKFNSLSEGVFSNKARVNDVNELAEQFKNRLQIQNKHLVSLYREFNTIYTTFNALDKDYIQRILVSLKAAEEANKKAVRGLEENKKTVDSQKMIIEVLKKHKTDLDELQHLKDIDRFYDEYQEFKRLQDEQIGDLQNVQDATIDRVLLLQENQDNTLQQINDLDGDFQDFKATQEKAFEELRSSQESTVGQFAIVQDGYTNAVQAQNESFVAAKQFQEEAAKKIQYLSIGLGVNFVAVIVLLVLIISGGL